MKTFEDKRPRTVDDARHMALAFPVPDSDGNFICPIDQKVYSSLKSLRNHLNTVHREDYIAARERMCGQVVPGPLPTEEQLVVWRKNPFKERDAAGLLAFDNSMFAGVRITPKGELDVISAIMRFTGCTEVAAKHYVAKVSTDTCLMPLEPSDPISTESAGTETECASKITHFQFGEGHAAPVAPMHVIIQILMKLPGPEAERLRRASYKLSVLVATKKRKAFPRSIACSTS